MAATIHELDKDTLIDIVTRYITDQVYNRLYLMAIAKCQADKTLAFADMFIQLLNEYTASFLDTNAIHGHLSQITAYAFKFDSQYYSPQIMTREFSRRFIPSAFEGSMSEETECTMMMLLMYNVVRGLMLLICDRKRIEQLYSVRTTTETETMMSQIRELFKREYYSSQARFRGETGVTVSSDYMRRLISEVNELRQRAGISNPELVAAQKQIAELTAAVKARDDEIKAHKLTIMKLTNSLKEMRVEKPPKAKKPVDVNIDVALAAVQDQKAIEKVELLSADVEAEIAAAPAPQPSISAPSAAPPTAPAQASATAPPLSLFSSIMKNEDETF